MPRTALIQMRATGPTGRAVAERTVYLPEDNPGPALAETARSVIAAWTALMSAELRTVALKEDLVDQLLAVMSGTAIDGSMMESPHDVLLGKIEDCIDDTAGTSAYPELLAAAHTWTFAQGAAIMDALLRLRARAQVDPDEGRSKALRAVGLR